MGARQVGKTYLIKEIFAKEFYKDNYVYIDLAVETAIREYYENEVDPKKIMNFISSVKNIPLTKSKNRNHNSNKLAIKISKNNYGYDINTKILTIPLYEVFLLASDLSKGEFEF